MSVEAPRERGLESAVSKTEYTSGAQLVISH